LNKILSLLSQPDCRHIALQSLVTITHHGGSDIRIEIAKHSAKLVKAAQENPNDHLSTQFVIVVLGHAIPSALDTLDPPSRKVINEMDIPGTLSFTINAVRQPWATRELFDHAVSLVAGPNLHCASDYSKNKDAAQFLVACMRSHDLASRCTAEGGLIRLHHLTGKEDQQRFDFNALAAAVKN
jgi:hypothetical protein